MGIRIRYFLIGMIIGSSIVVYYANRNAETGKVLSYSAFWTEPTPAPTLLPTPTNPPTPTLTPSPTLTPTPTITPTSTITPTPSLIPTPTVTSTPPPPPPTLEDMETLFNKFSGEYGVDIEILKRIADCETSYNPQARNGPYLGLYQFSENSWISNRTEMGQDTNPDLRLSAEESIKTAAFLISRGKLFLWPNCHGAY